MLNNGFTGTKRSWYCCGSTLGDGEESIDDSLPGDQWLIRVDLVLIATLTTHGPFLKHGEFFAIFQDTYSLIYLELPFFNVLHHTGFAIRHHDLMKYHGSFLDSTQDISLLHFIAHFGHGGKIP